MTPNIVNLSRLNDFGNLIKTKRANSVTVGRLLACLQTAETGLRFLSSTLVQVAHVACRGAI